MASNKQQRSRRRSNCNCQCSSTGRLFHTNLNVRVLCGEAHKETRSPAPSGQSATHPTTSIPSIIPEKLLFYFYTRSKTGRQTSNREINPQTKKNKKKKFAFIDPRQDGHLNHRPTHLPTLPHGKARKSQTGDGGDPQSVVTSSTPSSIADILSFDICRNLNYLPSSVK